MSTLNTNGKVEPIEWAGSDGTSKAAAFLAHPPRTVTRSLGDYTFVLQPAPYYEKNEDKYIQQFTKTVINVGGLPGNWDEPLGLPVEIVPLDKPYANWVGGVFRAVVLAEGDEIGIPEFPQIVAPSGRIDGATGSAADMSAKETSGVRNKSRPNLTQMVDKLPTVARDRRS